MIRERSGVSFYDYQEFDAHIDSLWADRTSGIYCYDASGTAVSIDSDQATLFIIDTGFQTPDGGEALFAAFQRNSPGKLDEYGWSGVIIGTKAELTSTATPAQNDHSAFEPYTSVGIYTPIARVIQELSGGPLSADDRAVLLKDSFATAQSTGKLAVIENQYDSKKQISFFPVVGSEVIGNARLFVKMEKNKAANRYTEWFGAFIVTEDALKDELLSFFCFHVGSLVFQSLSHANAFYNSLAPKAIRENWKWSDDSRNDYYSQPILKSYLEYTFYRLMDEDSKLEEHEKKIISYGGKSYFNSGLLDRNFRQINIVGTEQTLEKDIPGIGLCRWLLLSDVQAYSHNEHEIARMFREDEWVKEDDIERELLLTRIARDFDSARERAKLMAERNYKLAVPQFYKETNEIQFLLPICLGEREEAEKPQCALVLSLDKTGHRPYSRGETILTLDMAYNNTRLIAKPDVFWLNDLV